MKLSILIPSLEKREYVFKRLKRSLREQINALGVQDSVEILSDIDNGQKKIGTKRNDLLQRASGEYVAFVDDDDRVSETYIKDILQGLILNPDVLTLKGVYTVRGGNPKTFLHSIMFNGWYEQDGILYRYVNHLNCIKREHAIQAGFPEIDFGEDKIYSDRLRKLGILKTEFTVKNTLYYYDYIPKKTRHGYSR